MSATHRTLARALALLHPPFEGAAGKWVARKQAPDVKTKTYGLFLCYNQSCAAKWKSKRASKRGCITCRECGVDNHAAFLWVEDQEDDSDDESDA